MERSRAKTSGAARRRADRRNFMVRYWRLLLKIQSRGGELTYLYLQPDSSENSPAFATPLSSHLRKSIMANFTPSTTKYRTKRLGKRYHLGSFRVNNVRGGRRTSRSLGASAIGDDVQTDLMMSFLVGEFDRSYDQGMRIYSGRRGLK